MKIKCKDSNTFLDYTYVYGSVESFVGEWQIWNQL